MKISIITITHNRAHLIGETIQSVIDQTHADFEYIIIDDGSDDATEQVVKRFKDNRILYYKFPRCGNLSKLHNLGHSKAKGEIIAILDSDDIWPKNKLAVALSVFNDEAVNFITHNISYFTDIDNPAAPYYTYTSDFHENILDSVMQFQILPFPVILFRKKILLEMPYFNESFADGQQDFLIRAAAKFKVYFISESLTFMRLHNQNIHKKNIFPYFSNYYKSITKLALKKEIDFMAYSKGMFLNTSRLVKHLIN